MNPGNGRPTHSLDVIVVRVARRTTASPHVKATARVTPEARGVVGNASSMTALSPATLARRGSPAPSARFSALPSQPRPAGEPLPDPSWPDALCDENDHGYQRAPEREDITQTHVGRDPREPGHGGDDRVAHTEVQGGDDAPEGVDDPRDPRGRGADEVATGLDGTKHGHREVLTGADTSCRVDPSVVRQVDQQCGAGMHGSARELGKDHLVTDRDAERYEAPKHAGSFAGRELTGIFDRPARRRWPQRVGL